jgi:hypothetical protein
LPDTWRFSRYFRPRKKLRNPNRRIVKSLVARPPLRSFHCRLADARPDVATQQVATLPAVSQQGQSALKNVIAARQGVFESHVERVLARRRPASRRISHHLNNPETLTSE